LHGNEQLEIAVVGSGISGLSAAWLLSQRHRVTLYEADSRIGGHTHTVDVGGAGGTPVDTGFIVYNEAAYPNLTALFAHLGVPTQPTEMTFAVSLDEGRLEYSGTDLGGLFAQRKNLVSPRFWSMLRDLERFYRRAPQDLPRIGDISLGDYLDGLGCGAAFRDDHLYPMAAAIWSTPANRIPDYPAASFVRFCENHGLLKLANRPAWRTVVGGSREYVRRIVPTLGDSIRTASPVSRIAREGEQVAVTSHGETRRYDHVVIAAHADQALAMLGDADGEERRLLGAFHYRSNDTVLHSDTSLMPRRRRVWSSWNYASRSDNAADPALSVTYWMNRLQAIPEEPAMLVTLNPLREPDPALVHHRQTYEHPVFDSAAGAAQPELWSLQGRRRTWFCGAWFGSGFHEDGLQSGLAVAEQLGGVRRPWDVADESGRIPLGQAAVPRMTEPA